MKPVFNLTGSPLHFHGQVIPADGGSVSFPDDTFFPDRDLKLETQKVIAFGSLPRWFTEKKAIEAAKRQAPKNALVELSDKVAVQDEVQVSTKKSKK